MDLMLANLARMKATWPAPVWEWDPRFGTVGSSFAIELEPEVRESARIAFPRGWTAKSIDTAPDTFRALATRAGLRSRQRVLGGDEISAPALFGLWWPWGNADRITLRIGIMDATPEATAKLRALFAV